MTQNKQILKHLLEGHKITPMEALSLYGCLRLSARIFDLKENGWKIKTENVTKRGKTFAEYSLGK
jgi:hypothetical protein